MKLFILALLFLLLTTIVLGQSPAAIEDQLLAHLKEAEASGSYGGSYDEAKVDAANDQISEELLKNGNRPDVLRYAFSKLTDSMTIATSKDGKLRIYSWDLQTGGTMHDFSNVYQYQDASGAVHAVTNDDKDDESAGTFATQIFQAASKSGPVYLVNSTFIGSTSLAGQSIATFVIRGKDLDRKAKLIKTGKGFQNSVSFGYDFFSVSDHPERPVRLAFFDETKQAFRFPVVIEDDKTPQGRVTNKFITYRFNGNYFVKVS